MNSTMTTLIPTPPLLSHPKQQSTEQYSGSAQPYHHQLEVHHVGDESKDDNHMMLLQKLRVQVEYYFSDQNLATDNYLLSIMASNHGRVPTSVIASFPKVQRLYHGHAATEDCCALLSEAMQQSQVVRVDGPFLYPYSLPFLTTSTATSAALHAGRFERESNIPTPATRSSRPVNLPTLQNIISSASSTASASTHDEAEWMRCTNDNSIKISNTNNTTVTTCSPTSFASETVPAVTSNLADQETDFALENVSSSSPRSNSITKRINEMVIESNSFAADVHHHPQHANQSQQHNSLQQPQIQPIEMYAGDQQPYQKVPGAIYPVMAAYAPDQYYHQYYSPQQVYYPQQYPSAAPAHTGSASMSGTMTPTSFGQIQQQLPLGIVPDPFYYYNFYHNYHFQHQQPMHQPIQQQPVYQQPAQASQQKRSSQISARQKQLGAPIVTNVNSSSETVPEVAFLPLNNPPPDVVYVPPSSISPSIGLEQQQKGTNGGNRKWTRNKRSNMATSSRNYKASKDGAPAAASSTNETGNIITKPSIVTSASNCRAKSSGKHQSKSTVDENHLQRQNHGGRKETNRRVSNNKNNQNRNKNRASPQQLAGQPGKEILSEENFPALISTMKSTDVVKASDSKSKINSISSCATNVIASTAEGAIAATTSTTSNTQKKTGYAEALLKKQSKSQQHQAPRHSSHE